VFSAAQGSPPVDGYYFTGGITVNFNTEAVKTLAPPFEVEIWSAGGSGYTYAYNTTTKKVQIFVQTGASGAPLEEMPNSTAIPAAVYGDTIQYRAVFAKNNFFAS
jgi:hypothetical protein